MPCSETIRGSLPESRWRYTFTWTDGRLATADGVSTGLTDNDGKPQTRHEQCEYDQGRIARCDALGGRVEVHRDARGRIVEVMEGGNALAVTYDGAGDVVELAGRNGYAHSRLRYDDTHRLTAEEEIRRDGTEDLLSRYAYDARGRDPDIAQRCVTIPPLLKTMVVVGKEITRRRLRRVAEFVGARRVAAHHFV